MTNRPSATVEVMVVGEYFCDLIFSGLEAPPRLGAELFADGLTVRPGGCYNMALALTRLGISTVWATDFGTDLFSRLVLEQASGDGLDPRAFRSVTHSVQRISAAFSHGSERGFISFSETEVRPPDPALLGRLRPAWLLQSFRFDTDWLAFIAAAKANGASIFSDCRHGAFTLETPGVRALLALSDVFSPNEAEALALTGRTDLKTALGDLAALTPTVVIKLGPRGAIGLHKGECVAIAAPPMMVVDTIGAGDAFNAGYLAADRWGCRFSDCVRIAVACGSLSTSGAGSSATPDAKSLASFMNDHADGGTFLLSPASTPLFAS